MIATFTPKALRGFPAGGSLEYERKPLSTPTKVVEPAAIRKVWARPAR